MDRNPTASPLEAAEVMNRYFVDKLDALCAKALLPRVDVPDVSEEVPDVTGEVPTTRRKSATTHRKLATTRSKSATTRRRSVTTSRPNFFLQLL
jgi:hypothetical protein